MPRYLSIVFILSPVDCFDTISGSALKNTLTRWVGTPVLRLIKCTHLFFLCSIMMYTDDLINNRVDGVPHWRGLSHFTTYLSVEFTDGSKWEDMSKVRYDKYSNAHY